MTRFIAPRWLAFGAAAAALAALAAPGVARADTPVTTTIQQTFPVVSQPVQVGCPGGPVSPYVETVSESSLEHLTIFSDGSGTVKMQLKADAVAVPESDPSLPTYTGHAIENINAQVSAGQIETATENLSIVLSGSDGTHANGQMVERVTVNLLQPSTTVDFEQLHVNIVC